MIYTDPTWVGFFDYFARKGFRVEEAIKDRRRYSQRYIIILLISYENPAFLTDYWARKGFRVEEVIHDGDTITLILVDGMLS